MNTLPQDSDLARLAMAAEKLDRLLDQIVFVGGCMTELLLTDPGAAPIRPALDVDAIIAIGSYLEFTLLEGRLRELGFHQSQAEGAPICRWTSGDLILDLMPTDSSILGFSNRWYQPALKNAVELASTHTKSSSLPRLIFSPRSWERFARGEGTTFG